MSGILSKERDNKFVEKLIIQKILSVSLTNTTTKGLLISKCLLQYENVEFAKEIVKKFRNVFCPRKVTELDLCGNQITDAGVASLCQALQTPTC